MLSKMFKKYVEKNWDIKIEIDENWKIKQLSEYVVMQSEGCTKEDAYSKWIGNDTLHLPFWVCYDIVNNFPMKFNITLNNKTQKEIVTVKDLLNCIMNRLSKWQRIKVKLWNFITI